MERTHSTNRSTPRTRPRAGELAATTNALKALVSGPHLTGGRRWLATIRGRTCAYPGRCAVCTPQRSRETRTRTGHGLYRWREQVGRARAWRARILRPGNRVTGRPAFQKSHKSASPAASSRGGAAADARVQPSTTSDPGIPRAPPWRRAPSRCDGAEVVCRYGREELAPYPRGSSRRRSVSAGSSRGSVGGADGCSSGRSRATCSKCSSAAPAVSKYASAPTRVVKP